MIEKAPTNLVRCLVAILYLTGHRISEVLLLKKNDLKLSEDYIYIKLKLSKKKRTIKKPITQKHILKIAKSSPFTSYIIQYISALKDEDYLFESSYHYGQPFSRRWALNTITKLNDKAWCHLFRDTRVTKLLEAGATEQQVIVWFGWNDGRPLSNYMHRSMRMIDELADKLD